MSVTSKQSFNVKLVANGTILDLFQDEEIKISNNITNLFDLGTVPADFSRTIMLPGTKKNNAFFQHVYDIAVDAPYLFSTNVKVSAYLDFDGIYIVSGYLQLNKVSVYENKFIDSYEISLYGAISSFSRDINRAYLTDLTSLSQFNHTSSLANITQSWDGNLFGGDIVYPMADYGSAWTYTNGANFGIDDSTGAMSVQDFKPSIRIKKVWDAIMDYTGFTYSSSFWQQSWLDDVYMVCNNQLKYPIYSGVNLETYGQIKVSPISGSGMTNVAWPISSPVKFPWYNNEYDPQYFLNESFQYNVERPTALEGTLNLSLSVSGSTNNVPQFYLHFTNVNTSADTYVALTNFNNYFQDVWSNNTGGGGINNKYDISTKWTSPKLQPGRYDFKLEVLNYATPDGGMNVILDPGGQSKSYLEVNKVRHAADFRIMDIPSNMPYGTEGIKMVDWIRGIQKKFHLVIYPDKSNPNQLIVETFNNWYNKGEVKDFNKFINLNDKMDVILANNLAVNKLTFGDKLDNDYLGQQFNKKENRQYGESYFVDTQNFFSQGEFKVETTFASSPLRYLNGTGLSASVETPPITTNKILISDNVSSYESSICSGTSFTKITNVTTARLVDTNGNTVYNYTSDNISVKIKYQINLCYGGSQQFYQTIVIPPYSSEGSYTYTSSEYLDCGYGCSPQTIEVLCVSEIISTQLGWSISGNSQILSC